MTTATAPYTARRQSVNLALATWVSAINFWAWNMIGPLSTTYAGDMRLSSTQASMLVATPILVGSLGRIVVGSLTDRFGGRTMFLVVTLASIPPVLAVGAAGSAGSYPFLLVCGFFLGIAGTIFAVGIPFANNWYEPARRGFATGVFGMGMVGTALSAFFTPRFVRWFGLFATHAIIAVALAATAVLCIVAMRNAPDFRPNTDPVLPKLKAAVKLPVTWEMSFLYAVVFGGFVAFSNYLPTYIKTIYGFTAVEAAPHRGLCARRSAGTPDRRRAVGPHRSQVRRAGVVRRDGRAGVRRDVPAAAGRVVGRDVHHACGLPRDRYRWRVRVGGPPGTGAVGRISHRDRRCGRWFGRLLPAVGDGIDLRCRGQRLFGGPAVAGGDGAGRVGVHRNSAPHP